MNSLPHNSLWRDSTTTKKRQKAFGDGVRDLWRASKGIISVRKAAMSTNTGTQGGYLVPEEVALVIDDGLRETGVFHSLARRQPMLSKECIVPSFDMAAAHAAGTSPLFGGMTFTWTQEGTSITESEPLFSAVGLVARNLDGLVYASNQLVQDGGEALGAYLEFMFISAIEWFVERECFMGTLPGRPTGIASSPATATVTRQGASHVAERDLSGMVAKLLPACFKRAVWACHPTALIDIAEFNNYQVTTEVGSNGLCGTLMSRPLYVTEKLPPLGTQGDVMLFDPKLYVLGTRSIEVAVCGEEPTAFARNQTAFRITWRGDGQPIPKNTFTLQNGSTASAAFVALSDAA